MKVKNLDRLCIGVPKLDEGMALFSKVLGLEFEFSGENVMPNGNTIKLAISNQGIELLEVPDQKIHFRSFHFKVNDIDAFFCITAVSVYFHHGLPNQVRQ